jgi:hypothetical protein
MASSLLEIAELHFIRESRMLRPWPAAFLDLHQRADELFEELVLRPWAITSRCGWRPSLDLRETPDAYYVDIDPTASTRRGWLTKSESFDVT